MAAAQPPSAGLLRATRKHRPERTEVIGAHPKRSHGPGDAGFIRAPVASATAIMFGLWDQVSVPAAIAAAPIILWELSLGHAPSLSFLGLAVSGQRERWVAVGDEQERVCLDASRPAQDALDEVEDAPGVAAGEEHGEPGADHRAERGDAEEGQDDVMGDGQQPLHERQPAVEVCGDVRVVEVQVDRLSLVGGRVTGRI
jgi:hypothetical protein